MKASLPQSALRERNKKRRKKNKLTTARDSNKPFKPKPSLATVLPRPRTVWRRGGGRGRSPLLPLTRQEAGEFVPVLLVCIRDNKPGPLRFFPKRFLEPFAFAFRHIFNVEKYTVIMCPYCWGGNPILVLKQSSPPREAQPWPLCCVNQTSSESLKELLLLLLNTACIEYPARL